MTRPRSAHLTAARLAAVTAAMILATVLFARPAHAHDGHQPLPDGFRAAVTGMTDAEGATAVLDDVGFQIEPQGIGLTVTNRGPRLLEVTGEQAGEPLLRLTADRAWVNQASPQAVDVRGADVDPAAAAALIDLVWKRAPADWVALPDGGSVFVMDHRGAPGHAPARADYETGAQVAQFGVGFTYDGSDYRAVGTITAVPPTGGTGVPVLPLVAAFTLVAVVAGTASGRRAARNRATPRLA